MLVKPWILFFFSLSNVNGFNSENFELSSTLAKASIEALASWTYKQVDWEKEEKVKIKYKANMKINVIKGTLNQISKCICSLFQKFHMKKMQNYLISLASMYNVFYETYVKGYNHNTSSSDFNTTTNHCLLQSFWTNAL